MSDTTVRRNHRIRLGLLCPIVFQTTHRGPPWRLFLLIEDDDAVRGLFRAILEPVGYCVQEASTGREGIRRFRESPVDLVMTDTDMPHGDGVDVIRQLRADDPSVKILAVSGSKGANELRSDAQRWGADAILPKPVGVDELRAAVALSLESRRETPLR